MFHTYVLAFTRNVVDFDRASFLMDKDLLQASLDAMKHEQTTSPRWDADYGAQWVWDHYCELHFKRHGEPFGPQVIPHWDSGGDTALASHQGKDTPAKPAVMSDD